MLYIRADGNSDIGMGHVARCLSIAEAVVELNKECKPIFITADEECSQLIKDRGFKNIILGTDYRNMMSELQVIKQIFDKKNDRILVDSYQVSNEYFSALREYVWVACLEDMGNAYLVDLLINYNIYAPQLREGYQTGDYEDNVQFSNTEKLPDKLLLGLEYMPLRKSFLKPNIYNIKDKVTDVIITTGGSDPYFVSAALADAFLKNTFLAQQNIKLHIISGPLNSFAGELNTRYADNESIVIHENVKDMRELFLQGDVVICSAGSTIYEVSLLGIPMIIFYFAENQRRGAEAFAELTDIVNAGCFACDSKMVVDNIMKALTRCITDKEYRECICRQEKALLDGKGAYRIAKQLIDAYSILHS